MDSKAGEEAARRPNGICYVGVIRGAGIRAAIESRDSGTAPQRGGQRGHSLRAFIAGVARSDDGATFGRGAGDATAARAAVIE